VDKHRHHSIFFQLSPSSLYTYFENNDKVWHQYSTRIFENINLKDILTFCNMPHIKVMSCFSQIFSNPLYNLDMTICHQCFDFDIFGFKKSCTSNKAFLLHVLFTSLLCENTKSKNSNKCIYIYFTFCHHISMLVLGDIHKVQYSPSDILCHHYFDRWIHVIGV